MVLLKCTRFSTLVLILFLFGCNKTQEKLPFYNTADFTAEWIKTNDTKYDKIHTIDTFAMRNQLGNLITKDSLDGHIYVANFFFTICPSICPKMINNLYVLQSNFANNTQIKLVSFTVMPWVDSVARLREYAENHHINSNKWHLLTGKKERIYTLGRKSYFSEKKSAYKKTHQNFYTQHLCCS
jgi:protein SCO1